MATAHNEIVKQVLPHQILLRENVAIRQRHVEPAVADPLHNPPAYLFTQPLEFPIISSKSSGTVWTDFLAPWHGSHAAIQANPNRDAMLARIDFLRAEAADDGCTYEPRSADALMSFVQDAGITRMPAIVLMQNGNLRAVWQDPARDQIGIQFFADGQLQFVILRDRGGVTYKTMGVEPADMISRHVWTLDLIGLWLHG